jgi:anaerobic magnesium-protoporphyrin IX monomethyl ester cyclase
MSKVIMCWPPFISSKGQPQTSQNRQYQFFKDPTHIYPVIPATFITMMKDDGHQVFWLDAIAEHLSDAEFGKIIVEMMPDFMVFESNTMVFQRYAEVINGIKKNLPAIKIILTGEHVTAMPEHAKKECNADYFLMEGKWYGEAFKIISGKEWPKEKLLPHPDREISRWWLYQANGNFKYLPATYTMAAQDCWYRPKDHNGKSLACTFCTYDHYHPENKIRPVEDFLEEVEGIINFGFKEFFDDSGTFPVGKWLAQFCEEMIDRGYSEHIHWGINMRFGVLQKEEFDLMARAGCRFILWGFETGNQKTLDLLSKGYKIEKVNQNLIHSRRAGIWNHLTVMMGYPWETLEEEKRTFNMVKWLLVNDWAASMQATIFMPYPGTRAYTQAKEQGLLITDDWSKWTMAEQVLKLKYPFSEALKLQKKYYDISFDPRFIFNKLSKIRTKEDVKFYYRLGKKVVNRFGNLFDSQGVTLG